MHYAIFFSAAVSKFSKDSLPPPSRDFFFPPATSPQVESWPPQPSRPPKYKDPAFLGQAWPAGHAEAARADRLAAPVLIVPQPSFIAIVCNLVPSPLHPHQPAHKPITQPTSCQAPAAPSQPSSPKPHVPQSPLPADCARMLRCMPLARARVAGASKIEEFARRAKAWARLPSLCCSWSTRAGRAR